jgi:hypothetical protein
MKRKRRTNRKGTASIRSEAIRRYKRAKRRRNATQIHPPVKPLPCQHCRGLGRPPHGCKSCGRRRPVKMCRMVAYWHFHKAYSAYPSGRISKHTARSTSDAFV